MIKLNKVAMLFATAALALACVVMYPELVELAEPASNNTPPPVLDEDCTKKLPDTLLNSKIPL